MSERRTIAHHAVTVLVGQLAVMAFGVTDTIVAGRFSEHALAALSVGAAVYVTVFVALMGILQALLPVWAELHGAGRPADLGRSVRQALYVALIGVAIGGIALLFPGGLLHWTQVPPALQADVLNYLRVLALALPASLLFRMFSTLNQSLGRPKLVTWLQALSLVVKAPLTIWFAFGGAGLPAMGAVGCAWATVAVSYLMLLTATWLVRTQDMYRPYEILHRIERPDWRAIAGFARLGVPAGLSVMVEVTSFTLMALFIARQGTAAAAAHQIAANVAALMYMAPLSLAIASSSRVSYWMGANDPVRARAAIRTGLRMDFAVIIASATFVLLARNVIASIYSTNADVVHVASGLLAWVALYHLGDGTQVMCVFLLRCFRVTVAPFVAYCVLLWGMGLAGGYLLAYRGLGPVAAQHTPDAFWTTAAVALVTLALILPVILWRVVNARIHSAQPAAAATQAPRS